MGSFIIAILMSVLAAVVLSFTVYGMAAFSMACRQKRQSRECCSWSDAWQIVKSQWDERIENDVTEPRVYDDVNDDDDVPLHSDSPFSAALKTPRRTRTPKTPKTAKTPRTRKPRRK